MASTGIMVVAKNVGSEHNRRRESGARGDLGRGDDRPSLVKEQSKVDAGRTAPDVVTEREPDSAGRLDRASARPTVVRVPDVGTVVDDSPKRTQRPHPVPAAETSINAVIPVTQRHLRIAPKPSEYCFEWLIDGKSYPEDVPGASLN